MRKLIDPRQTRLFDSFDSVLTPQTRRRLLNDWPGVFRHVLLERMPADALADHFDPALGAAQQRVVCDGGADLSEGMLPLD